MRSPRSLLAERLARDDLDNLVHDQEDIKLKLSGICQDFREDISASHNLNAARYMRVKYEDLLETPTNTTLMLLERLHLPRDRRTLSLLEQVERKQLEQVSEWTGDLNRDLGAQVSEEVRQELSVPNINLEEDFIGRFVTSEVEDLLREECEDVMRTLGYNII